MSDKTGIEWTNATWNPVRGCTRISPGCQHCYAEKMAGRFSGPGQPFEGLVKLQQVRQVESVGGEPTGKFRTVSEARWTGEVRFVAEHLADPLRWRRPRTVFVDSMSDLFHTRVTNEQIAAVFGVMAAAPQHTFQILTKRAAQMSEWFGWIEGQVYPPCEKTPQQVIEEAAIERITVASMPRQLSMPWPLPNVWLGVSVEDQQYADERIPFLLETPAAVRFLSCEPLLGPLDISEYLDPAAAPCGETSATIDWVIAGCESGPGARPAEVDWYRSLRDQCAAAGVPFFLKQAVADTTGIVAPTSSPPEIVTCVSPIDRTRFTDAVIAGPGSKRKARDVIALPYLDGVQHAAMPRSPCG